MKRSIFKLFIFLSLVVAGCDNADDLLNQHIQGGPIVYAGKINQIETQSGYHRVRVNIYPAADVNRDRFVLRWSVNNAAKDSVVVMYNDDNYDADIDGWFTVIDLPGVEGNLLIEAQNFDRFDNPSLLSTQGAFIYGENYINTLLNAPVSFTEDGSQALFESRVGVVGNLVSYELAGGQFTEPVFTNAESLLLAAYKPGGILRSKTVYRMNGSDFDTLSHPEFLETQLPNL